MRVRPRFDGAPRPAVRPLLGALTLCALLGLAVAGGALAGAAPGRHASGRRARHACAHRRRARLGHCRRGRHAHRPVPYTPGASAVAPGATPGAGAGNAASGAGATGNSTAPAGSTNGGETTTTAPSGEAPGAPVRVQVLAKEYSLTLSRAEVPAGRVIVEFVNGGEDPHNLHLESGAGGEAGAFPTSAPKTHTDLSLELRPGSYTLFCALPEHEAKGMKATLLVH